MKLTKTRLRDMMAGGAIAALVLGLAVPALAATGSRTVRIDYSDIKLVVNGETMTLRDQNGSRVEPFTLDGSAYLPVRALGDALGMDVSWNSATQTITMNGTAWSAPDESGYIGAEAARAAALKHAGVKAANATFFKTQWDWEDGRAVYEVEFYSGDTEYDYDVDALTGAILSWDHEVEGYHIPSSSAAAEKGNYIGLERARSLAQAKAPKAALISCKLDWEDGRAVYEGELREGGMEYEFEIDAVTGTFLKWETDWDD